MINTIWLLLLTGGILYAGWHGRIETVTAGAISGAAAAVTLALSLAGVMSLWLGLMKIAEEAGLLQRLSALLTPLLRPLFPDVPRHHPALGAIALTLSANLLGMGNAVTPLGIKAMQQLQRLNPQPHLATPAMCTLLALCTTGFTAVPATVIALRMAAGSACPEELTGTIQLSSLAATFTVIILDKLCRQCSRYARQRR